MSNQADNRIFRQAFRFPIGTKFMMRSGKVSRLCTVTDHMTVTNSSGVAVKRYYEATHEFCGQTITDHEVCDTTIARNLADATIGEFS